MAMKLKDIKGFKAIRDSFKTRQVKYGGYAALITLAVFLGLLFLNLLVGQFQLQVDMTESGLFSLTEQSHQVVDGIQSNVIFYGLWRPGEEIPQLAEVINLYLARSRHIRLEVVDPNRNPGLVSRFDRTNQGIPNGSLVVEGEQGFQVITPMEMYDFMNTQQGGRQVVGLSMERRITMALLFVAAGYTPVIYEIQGHQEMPLAMLGLQDLIERENFAVRPLTLVHSDIPDDAAMLIINAPSFDLSREEADKVLDYLDNGGRLMIFVDYRTSEHEMINEIMASYGMRFDFGVLVENDGNFNMRDPLIPVPRLLEHDITNPLIQQRLPVVFRFSMGISEVAARRRTIELAPFLSSSHSSFLRTNLDETSFFMMEDDIPGPITIGMTAVDPSWIQGNEPQARIVAVASGPEPYAAGNIDMFLNSVTWLQDRPETLTVRSKSMFLLPMRITGFQQILYAVIIVILIPVGFFITGFVIWLKRRHL